MENRKEQVLSWSLRLLLLLTGIWLGSRLMPRIVQKQEPNTVTSRDILSESGQASSEYGISLLEEPTVETLSVSLPWSESFGGFYYEHLGEAEQVWYEDIYFALADMSSETELSDGQLAILDDARIDKIFQCVMNDHPEFFYVTGYAYTVYTYGEEITRISFSGTYTMEKEERDERLLAIEAAVEEILAGLDPLASDYEKVRYVYDYLVCHTEYDKQAEDNQNICSVFLNDRSVCQGYAKAAQHLLKRLGLKVTLIIGKVYTGDSHAWNLVWVDGEPYYMDVTWGDASYQVAAESDMLQGIYLPAVNYDYLCVTTAQLLKTHTPDDLVKLPECTATEANYYVMEGAYFTAYEEEAVAAFFERERESGKTDITLKCDNKEVYEAFLEELIEKQKIFRYLDSNGGTVAYTRDPDGLSLTFWLVNT